MEPSKKHGWPFWITVTLIALPILYVGSFGPACWISSRTERGAQTVSLIFQPLMKFAVSDDSLLRNVCYRYATIGAPEGWIIAAIDSDDGLNTEYKLQHFSRGVMGMF